MSSRNRVGLFAGLLAAGGPILSILLVALLIVALVVLVALVLGGCCASEPPEPERAPSPPHVIVISLDTVRADGLGCYGAGPDRTPAIDAFAASADRYASCTATSSWTLPSHASMFTGLFPFEHGTHGFLVDEIKDNAYPLHPSHATLAEELAVVGYDTAAFVANTVYLAERFGLGQGFATYEVKRQPASAATTRVLEFLRDRRAKGDEDPVFLFVNYMDAHRPYGAFSPEATLRLPREDHPSRLLEALCVRVMNEGLPPGELGERVRGLYALALTRLDAEVGRLLDGLGALGFYDNAVIVLTSDHGEAFGEHGLVEHGKDVYEPLVAVPLIVKRPGQAAGREIDTLASLVDVPGLCVDAIPASAGDELRPRFRRRPGNHLLTSEIHFARPRDLQVYAYRFLRERTRLRDGRYKLIVGGPVPELYDLQVDPGEESNLAAAEPGRVAALQQSLAEFLEQGRYRGQRLPPEPPSARQTTEMGVLGYGGGK